MDDGVTNRIRLTSWWRFIIFGRTEESFLNVLKMKSVLFTFHIRYRKAFIEDVEERGNGGIHGWVYILFDRDVTVQNVFSSLATINVKNVFFHFVVCEPCI